MRGVGIVAWLLVIGGTAAGQPGTVAAGPPPGLGAETPANPAAAGTAPPSGAQRPNILILYADDLGYGDLGCYHRQSKIPTPHLDRLAQSGMRFTDGHSSSGICTPSRYALLTGRYHWRDFHGIVNAFGGSVFKPERLTLPEMLQQKGYRTAAIGKWHLGWDWQAIRKPEAQPHNGGRQKVWGPDDFDWSRPIPDGPLAHGFDDYFGDTVINFPPYGWILNDRLLKAPDTMMNPKKWKPIKEGHWECRGGPMCSDWDPYQNIPVTTQKGVEYIRRQAHSDQPFFLYFAFPSPHAPIIPNDEFDGKSGAGPYGDFVVETDHACGRLLEALEETGQAENTIVIMTADNGPEHYAYPRDKKFAHWSAHPWRGLKRDIYEGGHRVPFIIRWPGVTQPGAVNDALVSQIDIMATLAEAVDFALPEKNAAEDSCSLVALLKGQTAKVRQHLVHNTFDGAWALRDGEWNLVVAKNGYHNRGYQEWEARRHYPPDDDGPVELYHLADDPGQRQNLARQHPEKVAAMQKTLKKIRQRGHSAPRLARSDDRGPAKPNVLLIAVDDLNDWIGCLGGHPQAQTPHIDRLAAQGMLFTNAHCQSPVCNPSRASLMTSLYPSSSGIYFLSPDLKESPVASKSTLMPQRFQDEGYDVTGAGKLFHGNQNQKYLPHYGGSFGGLGPLPGKKLSSFPGHPLWDWGAYPQRDQRMPDYQIASWAAQQLAHTRDRPLWMGVGFYRPHVPQCVPQKWFELYPLDTLQLPKTRADDLQDIPPYGIDLTRREHVAPTHAWVTQNQEWKPLVQSYLACVSFVDAQVGRVLDALETSGYRDHTYIVLFSDHGFHLGEKERWAKRSLWQDGAGVPLIIAGPGIGRGQVCDKPVQLLDIYPTLLALAGLADDPKLEGHSLAALLENPQADWPHVARTSFGPGNVALISEAYRYIRYHDGSEELYDRQADPHEWTNLAGDPAQQKVLQEQRARLPTRWHPVLGSGSTGHRAYQAAEQNRR